MPDLAQTLQKGRDIGFLRIVAELWGLDFSAPDFRVGVQRLAPQMLERETAHEMVELLPDGARLALQELLAADGALPWAQFARRFGDVRDVGPARRDRERPYENHTASAAEALWYRAVIGRQAVDTPTGLVEMAYIPEDLMAVLPPMSSMRPAPLGRPATPGERAFILPATDAILDDAATLLAQLRREPNSERIADGWLALSPLAPYSYNGASLKTLLRAAGLINARGAPLPEPVRAFLEAPRGDALLILARAWLTSPEFNDLRLIPSLVAEGAWKNDALAARRSVLDFLSTLPGWLASDPLKTERPFWSMPALVAAIHRQFPDYQRPEGDYDSWYLRQAGTENYLRGFESWDTVDGELVRFIISGPMFWLGMVELGFSAEPSVSDENETRHATAFRFSAGASGLLNLRAPAGLPPEKESVVVSANGRIHAPRLAGRAVRYQIARFAEGDKLTKDIYHYRLTPASLAAAQKQGLTVAHLLSLLRRAGKGVPPALAQALERWEAKGGQARIEQMTVLRLKDPQILQALQASRAARFLGDILSPTVVVIKPGAAEKVLDALVELGYLGES